MGYVYGFTVMLETILTFTSVFSMSALQFHPNRLSVVMQKTVAKSQVFPSLLNNMNIAMNNLQTKRNSYFISFWRRKSP